MSVPSARTPVVHDVLDTPAPAIDAEHVAGVLAAGWGLDVLGSRPLDSERDYNLLVDTAGRTRPSVRPEDLQSG